MLAAAPFRSEKISKPHPEPRMHVPLPAAVDRALLKLPPWAYDMGSLTRLLEMEGLRPLFFDLDGHARDVEL